MKEPAIYTKEREGVHSVYAIGVGDRLPDEIVVELVTKGIFPYGRVIGSIVPTLVFWCDAPGQKYLGMVMSDLRAQAFPERAGEVFNIHGEPQLESLQRITNIALAASSQGTRDNIFRVIAKAANFFPEDRYKGIDRYIGAKLDELLAAYEGNWQQLLEQGDLARFYTEGLREVRQREALRRNLIQSGLDKETIERVIGQA